MAEKTFDERRTTGGEKARAGHRVRLEYKWLVLSATTIGALMAAILVSFALCLVAAGLSFVCGKETRSATLSEAMEE